MKQSCPNILLALSLLAASWNLAANTANTPTRPSSSYNVRDFGTAGDGFTDDTEAIQRCISTAEANNQPYFKAETAFPIVIFPAGNYLVSRPLVIAAKQTSANLTIQGEGKVIIAQKYTDKDIFYMHYGYRQTVRNITFQGGKTQIRYFSRNWNRAQLLVEDCSFLNASDYAVDDAMHGVHHRGDIVAPYDLVWKDSLPEAVPSATEKDLPDIFYTSSMLHISRCEFVNCLKIARIFSDWGLISNCTASTSSQMQGAAIYSRGVLKIRDSNFFCKVNKENEQRLVDNIQAGIMLSNVTVDTDGEGICPVYNRRIYDNGGLYNIYAVINHCRIKAGGSKQNCFVFCEEVPNLISITNSQETSGTTIPAIGFRRPVTKEYLQHVSFPELVKRLPELAQIYGFMANMPRIYRIEEEKYPHNSAIALHNNLHLDEHLPEALQRFVEKPLPQAMENLFNRKIPCENPLRKPDRSINVLDFGAKGDGSNDDSQAIQAAFDAAGKHGLTQVSMPPGCYKISTPLILPPEIIIRGQGLACFTGNEQIQTLIKGENLQYAAFYDIGFFKANKAVDLYTVPEYRSRVIFEHCFFSGLDETAILCQAGNVPGVRTNLTSLEVVNCVFGVAGQVTVTNAAQSLWDACWFSLLQQQASDAKFINYGMMRITDCIGVPSVDAPNIWIDNHQTMMIDNMRFGGEGLFKKCLVRNLGESGTVFIKNSWISCTKGTVIRCHTKPQQIILVENLGPPDPSRQILLEIKAEMNHNPLDFFYERNNIPPTNIVTIP